MSTWTGVPFVKGHGTENDFVLLPDPEGRLELTPELVRRLCDRRVGVGGDGVLRVVPTRLAPEVASLADRAPWFMDYRNADGSLAEMCGNGVRVYARYLVHAGLSAAGELALATRHGVRRTWAGASGDVTVDMGTVSVAPEPVGVEVARRSVPAYAVDLGNPHAVVLLDEPVDQIDLGRGVSLPGDRFPAGANVEVVNVLAPGRLRMRVLERGVGETRSCGTGACAAAAAAGPGRAWTVEQAGGRLQVDWSDGSVRLTGPAVLVASGELWPGQVGAAAGKPDDRDHAAVSR